MIFLYQMTMNRDANSPVLYDKVVRYRITERRKKIDKKGIEYYEVTYHNGDKHCKRRVTIEEGIPYDRTLSFWIEEENENKVIDIFKEAIQKDCKNRKKRINKEATKVMWLNSYIKTLESSITKLQNKKVIL